MEGKLHESRFVFHVVGLVWGEERGGDQRVRVRVLERGRERDVGIPCPPSIAVHRPAPLTMRCTRHMFLSRASIE